MTEQRGNAAFELFFVTVLYAFITDAIQLYYGQPAAVYSAAMLNRKPRIRSRPHMAIGAQCKNDHALGAMLRNPAFKFLALDVPLASGPRRKARALCVP